MKRQEGGENWEKKQNQLLSRKVNRDRERVRERRLKTEEVEKYAMLFHGGGTAPMVLLLSV